MLDQPVATDSIKLGLQVVGRDLTGTRATSVPSTSPSPTVPCRRLTLFPDLTEDSDWQLGQTLGGELAITAGSDPLVSIAFDASQPGLQGLSSGQQSVTVTVADHHRGAYSRWPAGLYTDSGE